MRTPSRRKGSACSAPPQGSARARSRQTGPPGPASCPPKGPPAGRTALGLAGSAAPWRWRLRRLLSLLLLPSEIAALLRLPHPPLCVAACACLGWKDFVLVGPGRQRGECRRAFVRILPRHPFPTVLQIWWHFHPQQRKRGERHPAPRAPRPWRREAQEIPAQPGGSATSTDDSKKTQQHGENGHFSTR